MQESRIIQSRGALQYVKAVLSLADDSNFDFHYNRAKVNTELLKRRNHYKQAQKFLRSNAFQRLPCGQDDYAIEKCESIAWNFWTYFHAQQVNAGKMPSKVIKHWHRAIG